MVRKGLWSLGHTIWNRRRKLGQGAENEGIWPIENSWGPRQWHFYIAGTSHLEQRWEGAGERAANKPRAVLESGPMISEQQMVAMVL